MLLRRSFALALVLAVPSLAAAHRSLRVVPWVYDPGHHDGKVSSAWRPFLGPDNLDPALVLWKFLDTPVDAAAGASVEGVHGATLYELGFDVFDGGHCGAGAPRFNVVTDDGNVYLFFFGCFYGTHTPSPDKPATFTRVRFGDKDAFKQYGTQPDWPGFGHARIQRIDLVFDEGDDNGQSGFTAVDNIDVNGELVGRGHEHDR